MCMVGTLFSISLLLSHCHESLISDAGRPFALDFSLNQLFVTAHKDCITDCNLVFKRGIVAV